MIRTGEETVILPKLRPGTGVYVTTKLAMLNAQDGSCCDAGSKRPLLVQLDHARDFG